MFAFSYQDRKNQGHYVAVGDWLGSAWLVPLISNMQWANIVLDGFQNIIHWFFQQIFTESMICQT